MKPLEEVSSLINQNKSFKMKLKENVNRYKHSLTYYSEIQSNHLALLKRAKSKLQEYKQNYSENSRSYRVEVENFSEVRKS